MMARAVIGFNLMYCRFFVILILYSYERIATLYMDRL